MSRGRKQARTSAAAVLKPAARRGLKIKAVPDVDLQQRLRGSAEVGDPARSLTPALQSAVQTLTSAQLAVQAVGVAANQYLQDDAHRRLSASLVSIRQMYAVAYRSLQESIAAEAERRQQQNEPELPGGLEDFLVQYAAYTASKPFSEHTLMRSIMDATLPWLADVIDSHTTADENQNRAERLEAEEARRGRSVAIGLTHSPMQDDPGRLQRSRSLVLAGWRNAVEWLLDKIVAYVGDTGREGFEPVMTIRLKADSAKPEEQHARLVTLNAKQWAGCADSPKQMARCMGEHVADRLSAKPDLLICDRLANAFTRGFVGRDAAANAGDAHKVLRKWADLAGAALLGGICLSEKEAPDTTGLAFEQLRVFADLRRVSVHENDEATHYRVIVGENGSYYDVEKATLDGYDRGAIVQPGAKIVQ